MSQLLCVYLYSTTQRQHRTNSLLFSITQRSLYKFSHMKVMAKVEAYLGCIDLVTQVML